MTAELEASQRAAVVAGARAWLGTAYHHGARLKDVGVDCIQLLAAVYETAGVIPAVEIPYYPIDWNLHRDAERYMEGLLRFGREIAGPPLPGDVAIWKFGRCFAHGAIVVEWPVIIHAHMGTGCVLEDAERSTWLMKIGESGAEQGRARPRKFFSCWGA